MKLKRSFSLSRHTHAQFTSQTYHIIGGRLSKTVLHRIVPELLGASIAVVTKLLKLPASITGVTKRLKLAISITSTELVISSTELALK